MDHRPRKRFGQHFLHDAGVVSRIIDAFAPQANELVVEIGPGPGVLTRKLAGRVAKLIAVEIDRDLAATLKTGFADDGSVQIDEADALKFDYCALVSKDQSLRIIGNLPYNISTPLIFHLFDQAHCVQDMLFMLQKEVVDRICANPGSKNYGRLSVMAQWQCKVKRLFTVPAGAFTPPPKVESAIVYLKPYQQKPHPLKDYNRFARLVQAAFTQRRKTLRNSIKAFISADQMQEISIDPARRAETLSVAEFVALAEKAGEKS
ncbi:MAG: 16S rRNA (adenine(1518)-N(6)/adenine(1519)-N(6))-dimethyltransferase RsmA [Acidiferrobacterales bacterium]